MKLALRLAAIGSICVALMGCATEELYAPTGRQSQPQRWSDPVRVCIRSATVVSQLRLAIGGVYVPDGQETPCAPPSDFIGYRDGDDAFIGEGKVDPSGRGGYAMSYYNLQVDNLSARQRGEGLYAEQLEPVLKSAGGVSRSGKGVRIWRYHEQIYSRDEIINGRKWRHYAFAIYDSLSDNPDDAGIAKTWGSVSIAEDVRNAAAVAQIAEVYVYTIDDEHAVIALGRYERMVIEDGAWYASRVALLADMVKSLELREVSTSEIDEVRHAYQLRHRSR